MGKNLYIFQASAGSGKTRRLVLEYLLLAFAAPDNYKHTLAITFTNKATEEMKNRVVEYLINLSEGKDEKLEKDILAELKNRGVDVHELNIRKSAADILGSILHDYSKFNISTIDSFCIKIIKSFARELGLPAGFGLELDSDMVLENLTNSLLDSIGKDETLTRYIEDYIIYQLGEEKTWNIDADIKEFGKQIISEKFWNRKLMYKDDVYDDKDKMLNLISGIKTVKFSFEEFLKKESAHIIDLLKREGISYDALAGGKVTSVLKYCEKLQNEVAEPSDTLMKNYRSDKGFFKVDTNVRGDVMSTFGRIVSAFETEYTSYRTACAIFKTVYNIGILGDLLRFLDSYRKYNRTVLSTDINNFLRLLISDDISPFIYEKAGIKLKYFMLDEFQDTSQFQWDNIKPLLVNSLSEKYNSLIVGDVKQSIYRWRNGDMRLLLNGVERDLAAFKELIHKDTLNVNYRSHKEIVEFNNRFFESLKNFYSKADDDSDNEYLLESYAESVTRQETSNRKNDGYVEINFFDYVKDALVSPNEESGKRVTEILSELKDDGYKPGDILVLVRSAEDSRSISAVITKAGYNVVSSLSLLLSTSEKVNFIVSTLKFLGNSRNKLARTEMLYYYNLMNHTGKSASEIFCDSAELHGKLFTEQMPDEFFKEDEKPKRLPVLYNLTVFELVEHIIGIFGINKQADPYIIKFVDEVFKFSEEKDSDVNSFLEFWEKKKDELSINLPEDSESVRVMTIHKSKGLESRVVIVPYANWEVEISGNKDRIWASADAEPFNRASAYFVKATKEIKDTHFAADYYEESRMIKLDNVNMLYVSLTRPEERLYLNVPQKSRKSIANTVKAVIEKDYPEKIKDNRLVLGKRIKSTAGENKNEYSILNDFNSSPYYKKLFIRPSYRKLKVFENERMKIKTDNGVVVHKLLSYIVNKDDVDSALNRGLMEGVISISEKDKFRNLIVKTIESDDTKDWFGETYEVRSESEILTPDNKILRPDRVMLKGDNAVIVDYKTGREEKKHGEQLNLYANVLKKMGYGKVDKYLLYINDFKDEISVSVKHLNGGKDDE